MSFNPFGNLFQIWPSLFGVWFIAIAILHIAFAIGVASDASEYASRHGRTAIVGSFLWMLATLVGGVFIAATYWLIHRSTLSPAAKQNSLTIS